MQSSDLEPGYVSRSAADQRRHDSTVQSISGADQDQLFAAVCLVAPAGLKVYRTERGSVATERL